MPNDNEKTIVSLSQIKLACRNCSLHQLCLPIGISESEMDELENIITRRRPLRRGEYLFQQGDNFHAIYAIRSGSIKTYTISQDGTEQITGFHLPGELIGLDAIHEELHTCSAEALDSASFCEIPYNRLESLSGELPGLRHQLLRVMSREIHEEQSLLLLMAKKSAESRLASLLLSFANRFHDRGFSESSFRLSMSRNDIGNYLGLAVETVSRIFSRFQEQGVLNVSGKLIEIRDRQYLHDLAGQDQGGSQRQNKPQHL